ncbi:DUF488 domain-containing protein [Micromonospora sp. NPDC049559]|uniref:DUF488 domain-containing protein n=1 Tax=Micromonospora sp. NPDC049559 TaxID=3155923 RepID=UPI00342E0BAD
MGYEGQEIGRFVAQLCAMGVSRLVDVRLTPISRKRGFSKTALAQALADAGIVYEHRRELGNPKANRPGFTGPPEKLAEARAAYATLLARVEAAEALDAVVDAGRRELVALLCFEADQRSCHREVVLQAAQERFGAGPSSLGPKKLGCVARTFQPFRCCHSCRPWR